MKSSIDGSVMVAAAWRADLVAAYMSGYWRDKMLCYWMNQDIYLRMWAMAIMIIV